MEQVPAQQKHWFKPLMWFLALFILVFLGTIIIIDYHNSKKQVDPLAELTEGSDTQSSSENINQAARSAIPQLETSDDPYLGPKDANIIVVEFGDFQCPYCQSEYQTVREVAAKYQSWVKFIFRDFPLSQIHDRAQAAAEAAGCAFAQGNEKFWAYHDKLFQSQDKLADADLKNYAVQIGLDEKKFSECISKGERKQEINEDFADGVANGVTGTPTFFFNGKKVKGLIPKETFEKALDLFLK
ncbi:MAG: DsbA family protein [Patescibacteria group bacterium]|jgi:protein-disulfide isomerase